MKKLLITSVALAALLVTPAVAATTYEEDRVAFNECMVDVGFVEGKTFQSKLKTEDGSTVGILARVKNSVLKDPIKLTKANACAKEFGIAEFS